MVNCKYPIFVVVSFSIIHCSYAGPQNHPKDFRIKYKLTDRNHKTTIHDKDIVTSQENAISIKIEEDFPYLFAGMLHIREKTGSFYMDGHDLFEIQPGAFDRQNLNVGISLRYNKLTEILTNTFTNLEIHEIHLDNNEITHIDEGAFFNMPRLWKVCLMNNDIARFHSTSFINTPMLYYLDFTTNKLKSLQNNWFSFLGKDIGAEIKMGENQIDEIHPEAFQGVDVKELLLYDNQLLDVPGRIFHGTTIKVLDLSNNILESLPEEIFEQRGLDELRVSGNSLSCAVVERLKRFANENKAEVVYSKGC